MEIPYTVQPRPDTGLYNAKVGIWLFLASEVMLFGALVFRLHPAARRRRPGEWPHGWLNVPLGTVNTLVLALSAITTLLAWVACKMRQFGQFKFFHACTLLLALTFLCIKGLRIPRQVDSLRNSTDRRAHSPTATCVENNPKEDYVVIDGRYVTDEKDLYDLRAQKDIKTTEINIPRSQIKEMQNYGPWHNTYLAIYFTLTGLHALHILGGSIVIGYLWGPGSRMWKTDPERFTNRIEVSGLFWHFVDLVWIFLFPVLYLT